MIHPSYMKSMLLTTVMSISMMSYGQKADTALVTSYYNVPVFFHCKPLAPYRSLGKVSRSVAANNASEAFQNMLGVADENFANYNGIIADELTMNVDSFEAIRFTQPDGRNMLTLQTGPVFFSSVPLHRYEVIDSISESVSFDPLNKILQEYWTDAQKHSPTADGIIVRDVNYSSRKNKVLIFRWKK